ncbi:MAG: signal recognition particle receptor subunit alpha, partial [Bacteroidota bacterium]
MFETLVYKLKKALNKLTREGIVSEVTLSNSLKELRIALVSADVCYQLARDFTDQVKEKAIQSKNIFTAENPKEVFISIVKDELINLMVNESINETLLDTPEITLLISSRDSGKIDFSQKLAVYLKEQEEKNPLLIYCDISEPSQASKLDRVAKQYQISTYIKTEHEELIKTINNSVEYANLNGLDPIIISTKDFEVTGDENLKPINSLRAILPPHKVFLVLNSLRGQEALYEAKSSCESIDIDNLILTRVDQDKRGGAVFFAKAFTGKSIIFLSKEGQVNNLQAFKPTQIVEQLFKDVESLKDEDKDLITISFPKKILQFNSTNFINEVNQIREMGGVDIWKNSSPETKKLTIGLDLIDKVLVKAEHMVQSMTPKERKYFFISNLRKKQIAYGS